MEFDPVAYKASIAAEWEKTAAGWHRWIPLINAWLEDVTETMLDEAAVTVGSRVVDIAAGDGGQSVAAARRTTPTGEVLATDIAQEFITITNAVAVKENLPQLSAKVMDAESLDQIADDRYDAAISRLGLMYLPDLHTALREMRRVLRPGGRIAAIVFTTAERTPFFSIPTRVIRKRRGLPAPDPTLPGPFSLGAPGLLKAKLAAAGYHDVREQFVEAPLRFASAAECVQWRREASGTVQQMLVGLTDSEKAALWQEIEENLSQFETADGFESPCQLLICSATA